jgi:carboxylesterase type B
MFGIAGPRYLQTHRLENSSPLTALRATHGVDETILWNDAAYAFAPDEDVLATEMERYWTNFAKTGDPNGAGLPAWPLFTASTEKIPQLETTVGTIARYHTDSCTFISSLPGIFPNAGQTQGFQGYRRLNVK